MASGIEFDEDKYGLGGTSQSQAYAKYYPNAAGNQYSGNQISASKMGQWLVLHHLAQTPQAANKLLTVVIFINFIIAAIIVKLAL